MADTIDQWWTEWFGIEAWSDDEEEWASPAAQRKVRLKKYFNNPTQGFLQNPAGATSEMISELNGLRTGITNGFGGGAPAEKQLDDVSADISKLRVRIEAINAEIAQARLDATAILQRVGELTDPEGSVKEDSSSLETHRENVRTELGTDNQFSNQRIVEARKKLVLLEARHTKVLEDIVLRAERVKQQEEIPAIKVTPGSINKEHVKKIVEKRTAVLGLAESTEITVAGNTKVKDAITEYRELIRVCKEEMVALRLRETKVKEDLKPYETDPDSLDPEQKDQLDEARRALQSTLSKDVTKTSMDTAESQLPKLKELHEAVGIAVGQSKEGVTNAFKEIPGGELAAGLMREFGAGALQKMLPDLGGAKAVGQLAQRYAPSELKALIADLGSPKALGDFLKGPCEGNPATLQSLKAAFGTAKAVADVVAGPLAGKPKIFTGLLKSMGGDAAKLKTILDGFGGDYGDLTNLVANGGLTAKVGDTEEDAVDPGLLGKITGVLCADETDAGKLKEFCASFRGPKDAANLKGLLVDGGFGAKPDLVLQTLTAGSGDNPETFRKIVGQFGYPETHAQFKTLTKDPGGLGDRPEIFGSLLTTVNAAGDPAQARLFFEELDKNPSSNANFNNLIKDGGFGSAKKKETGELEYDVDPDCMGRLFKDVCGKDRGAFKKFINAYSKPQEVADLKKTLVEGGLGKRPDCLIQMITVGFDGSSTAKVGDATTSLKQFSAKLSEEPPTHGKLKKLLEDDDGLGGQPEVFGHLIATGCDKKPESAHTLLKTFDDEGLGKLNDLVKEGGFAKNDAKGVKPQCLGKLLSIGCGGAPGDLQTLVKGISADDRTHFKGIMEEGKLGKEPDALGHFYKTGCDKNPVEMHKFCEEFKTTTDQQKLKGLLENGGFNGRKGGEHRPETLGEVMKEGFSDRGKNPGEQLKKLHDAFKPAVGTDDSDKLKTIVDSFNFSGKTTNLNGKPGKRFNTLMKHFGDDPSKVKTVFSVNMEAQLVPGTQNVKGNKSNAPYLSKEELIANAATFECEPLPPMTDPTSPPRPPDVTETDMGHFATRHMRKYQTLSPPRDLKNADTTMWEEDKTTDQVKAVVEEAHKEFTKTAVPGLKGANVQVSKANLSLVGGAKPFKAENVTASGYPVRIGFEYKPATVGPPPTLAKVANTQFYPKPKVGLQTINNGDLTAIKLALGK